MSEFVETNCSKNQFDGFQVVKFDSKRKNKTENKIKKSEENQNEAIKSNSSDNVIYLSHLYNEIKEFGMSDFKNKKLKITKKPNKYVKKQAFNYKKYQDLLRIRKQKYEHDNSEEFTGKSKNGLSMMNTQKFYKKLNKIKINANKKNNEKILKYYGKIDSKKKVNK